MLDASLSVKSDPMYTKVDGLYFFIVVTGRRSFAETTTLLLLYLALVLLLNWPINLWFLVLIDGLLQTSK